MRITYVCFELVHKLYTEIQKCVMLPELQYYSVAVKLLLVFTVYLGTIDTLEQTEHRVFCMLVHKYRHV